jgi:hypothetical protein
VTPAELPHAIVDAAFPMGAFGLAGLATALLCRLVATVIVAHLDRADRASAELIQQTTLGVQVLERINLTLGSRVEQLASGSHSPSDRERSLAEIDRATRLGQWADAAALLEAFAARFPEDPNLPGLTAQLDAGRRRSARDQMAQLEAARQVNDPTRVLELYQAVRPALELEQRTALERDLASWFLSLMQRRLRTGKIQPEVVALATQVAETFATTAAGASMHAALPTLRRSVGLCPRCAQPYAGIADACPKCLSGEPHRVGAHTPEPPARPSPNHGLENASDDSDPCSRSD